MTDVRPDPDALLARVKAEEPRGGRGHLKVFLGACAGVGKTYAMLESAQIRRREGVDVVVGVAETHKRRETEALLQGLDVLPRAQTEYRGVRVAEFDLDAALGRKPALLLVDELAHTNAPGSRHPKRWQDVKELLECGIDVYTTLNIQHIESLNDVVAQITGILVQETVPDNFVEGADVVELVDLPSEELLKRLEEGKVYLGEQAVRAAQGFFKPENLTALRELALRFTAEKVNRQVETFRLAHPGTPLWATQQRVLVLVGPSPSSEQLIRKARRRAGLLRCEWIALHVDSPSDVHRGPEDRDRIVKHLRLAERLGGEAVTIPGQDLLEEVLAYARQRNVTSILVGKPQRRTLKDRLFGSFVGELVRQSGEIDVVVTQGGVNDGGPARPAEVLVPAARPQDHASAVLVVALCTLVCAPLYGRISETNLVMIYLVGVMGVASRLGKGPSVLAAVLSVLAFDFFYVQPRFSFAVSDTQYIMTFLVMLAASLVISTLTLRIREALDASRLREQRTAALHAMARKLAGSRGLESILQVTVERVAEVFECEVALLLPDEKESLQVRASMPPGMALDYKEQSVAQWVYDLREMAGLGTDTLPGCSLLFIPLLATRGVAGVLGIRPSRPERLLVPEQLRLLEALAQQAALALEVDRLGEEGQRQLVEIQSERLRTAILSSVSHDLRTPLAAITGAASSLLDPAAGISEESRRELLQTIYEEGDRLGVQVNNLLEMIRLQAGVMKITKEPLPLEDPIGSVRRRLDRQLQGRSVAVSIAPDVPPVPTDAVLIENVFFNLLENAVRYTPPGSPIEVTAAREGDSVLVQVADHGPGFSEGEQERVFEKFFRGLQGAATRGAGLGLSICKGIVEAHGGRIWARNRSEGGAIVAFTLPLPQAPTASVPSTQAVAAPERTAAP